VTESKHPLHNHQTGPEHSPPHHDIPYWQRAHKDWRFWIGVVLMFAAIYVYVMTIDLSTVPHQPATQTTQGLAP
jgi:hypothetical protein